MSKLSRKKIFFSLWIAIIIVGSLYIIFNENGLIKYYKIGSEVDSLNLRIENVEKENENLKNEVDSLKRKIPAKMEQVAREQYGMKKENEIRIEVKEDEDEK